MFGHGHCGARFARRAVQGRPGKAGAEAKESKKSKKGDLIPRFDATAHVVGFLSDLFGKERFHSPLERQEFALEVTSHARQLALRLRREGAKDRYLAVSERPGGAASKSASATSRLRDGIRHLDQNLKKLHAAMEKGGSLSGQSSSESEVKRLEEVIEKIGSQIQSAEEGLKILLGKKSE